MSNTAGLEKIIEKKQLLLHGDKKSIQQQHDNNKFTAYERISLLLDPNSFVEMYALLSNSSKATGVITGYGTVNSRPIYVIAQDFTVNGGAMGKMQSEKVCKLLDMALTTKCPIVAFFDSAGVNLEEGIEAMDSFGKVYSKLSVLNGICPSLAIISGPCLGAAAIMSQLFDFSILANSVSKLSMYGPTVLNALNNENFKLEDYASANSVSQLGVGAIVAENEKESIEYSKLLLSMLPDSNEDISPEFEDLDLNRLVPEIDTNNADDILMNISDVNSYIELYKDYGSSIKTAIGRLGGVSVAFVVCNAMVNDGLLGIDALNKAARFINLADNYNLPIISIVNTKGLEISNHKMQISLINAQSKLLYAYSTASVPKISLIIENAIGHAYLAMAGSSINDMVFAWPNAVISALNPNAAIQVVWQDKIKNSDLPLEEAKSNIINEYVEEKASALVAGQIGIIDDVIDPKYSRMHLISSLDMLLSKNPISLPKKHGNLPF